MLIFEENYKFYSRNMEIKLLSKKIRRNFVIDNIFIKKGRFLYR